MRTQSPWPVLFLLIVIFALGMVKEFLSDYKRKVSDNETNHTRHSCVVGVQVHSKSADVIKEVRRRSLVVQASNKVDYNYFSKEVMCQDIKVGDLLILKDNMIVPADCVVIKTFSGSGECQVQTGQLDGERSLKPKYSLK